MKNKRRRKIYSGVRQRGSNSFEINYYLNGERLSETVQASSEAEAYAIRLQRMVGHQTNGSENRPSLEVPLDGGINYYLSHTEKLLQGKTRQRSECIYKHFIEFLKSSYPGVRFVNQITAEIGNKYKDHLLSLPNKSTSGINTDISKLRAIFTKFEEYNFVKENPFKRVEKIPSRLAKPQKKHLPTDYEIKCILSATKNDPSYDEITKFLVRVGRRIEETTLYEKKDVLLDENKKPIRLLIRPETSKNKEGGELSLDEELSEIIKKALLKHPEESYLFTNKEHRKISQNTYRDVLSRITKEYKLNEITPHCFRYYVVNKLLNSGINLKDAMAITGHLDIESFMSYVKTTEEGRQRALAVTRLGDL